MLTYAILESGKCQSDDDRVNSTRRLPLPARAISIRWGIARLLIAFVMGFLRSPNQPAAGPESGKVLPRRSVAKKIGALDHLPEAAGKSIRF